MTEQLIADCRSAAGIVAGKVNEAEIVKRCVFALANERACILEEGIAARASEIDIACLNGYGFPLHRAGRCCMPTSSA